jgi:hypothetical protein
MFVAGEPCKKLGSILYANNELLDMMVIRNFIIPRDIIPPTTVRPVLSGKYQRYKGLFGWCCLFLSCLHHLEATSSLEISTAIRRTKKSSKS